MSDTFTTKINYFLKNSYFYGYYYFSYCYKCSYSSSIFVYDLRTVISIQNYCKLNYSQYLLSFGTCILYSNFSFKEFRYLNSNYSYFHFNFYTITASLSHEKYCDYFMFEENA